MCDRQKEEVSELISPHPPASHMTHTGTAEQNIKRIYKNTTQTHARTQGTHKMAASEEEFPLLRRLAETESRENRKKENGLKGNMTDELKRRK